MFKTTKPWLNYRLGYGCDKVEYVAKRTKRKLSTTIWMFGFFGVIGGHRLYLGDGKSALRWFIFLFLSQLVYVNIYIFGPSSEPANKICYGVFYLVFIALCIMEIRSVRSSIRKINQEIEVENGR